MWKRVIATKDRDLFESILIFMLLELHKKAISITATLKPFLKHLLDFYLYSNFLFDESPTNVFNPFRITTSFFRLTRSSHFVARAGLALFMNRSRSPCMITTLFSKDE